MRQDISLVTTHRHTLGLAITALLLAIAAILLAVAAPAGAQQTFTNVTSAAGITGQHGLGHAVGWCDIDNDGDQDLAFSNQDGSGFWLYRNNGGSFTNITASAGLGGTGAYKILWAELTGDDYADLIQRRGSSYLYRNNGDGTFTNITGGSGLSGSVRGVADFDDDGNVDLLTFSSSTLYVQHNLGDGNFSAPEIVGTVPDCWTTICFDYDLDGLDDIYVGTYGATANQLFHNEGDGSFVETAASAGLAYSGRCHGLDVGDYDNDGWCDVYVGAYSVPGCKLYRNLGDGTFGDVTAAAGVSGHNDTRTVSFNDFDNDGWLDIFVSHHDFYSYSNIMWHSNGDGTFSNVGAELNLSGEFIGDYFGVGWADYNGDGAIDLFAAGHIDKYRLFRNDNCPGNFLIAELVGTASNRSAIGAMARLYFGDTVLTRFVIAGSGRQDFHSLPLEFGMGDSTAADSLVITWPSGGVQRLGALVANQHLMVVETAGPTATPQDDLPRPTTVVLTAAPNPFNPRTTLAYELATAGHARLTVHDLAGRLVAVLVDAELPAGRGETVWDGKDAAGRALGSGVYIARLQARGRSATAKLILAR